MIGKPIKLGPFWYRTYYQADLWKDIEANAQIDYTQLFIRIRGDNWYVRPKEKTLVLHEVAHERLATAGIKFDPEHKEAQLDVIAERDYEFIRNNPAWIAWFQEDLEDEVRPETS